LGLAWGRFRENGAACRLAARVASSSRCYSSAIRDFSPANSDSRFAWRARSLALCDSSSARRRSNTTQRGQDELVLDGSAIENLYRQNARLQASPTGETAVNKYPLCNGTERQSYVAR